MKMPILTIAIVHFNTAELTQRCILSILKILDNGALSNSFEISIVDNRSELHEYEALGAFLKELNRSNIFLYRNCMNSGFGLGCMLALNNSAGKYIAFVNSDTFFKEDCFLPLVDFMESNPQAGVVAPQHKDGDGRLMRSHSRFDSLGSRFLGSWVSRLPLRQPVELSDNSAEIKLVDFVLGSFMLVRRDSFADVGGFDPNIFLYCEEMDLCLRLKKAGFSTYFMSGFSYYHLGNASGAKLDGGNTVAVENLRFEAIISMLYITRKHHGALYFVLFFSALVTQYFFKAIFKSRNRRMFVRLISSVVPQACSLRVSQPCNFDAIRSK